MDVIVADLSLGFSEEQAMLLQTAEAFCRNKSPIETVRGRLAGEVDDGAQLWREITELGWLGLAVPEEFGGVGLGLAEAVCIAEPMGRHLLAGPFVGTTLVAQALLRAGTLEQQDHWLPKICAGTAASLAIAEAHGDWDLGHLDCRAERSGGMLRLFGAKTFVLEADRVELLLVSVLLEDTPALILLETAKLGPDALTAEIILDETRRSFRLNLDGLEVPETNLLAPDRTGECLDYLAPIIHQAPLMSNWHG